MSKNSIISLTNATDKLKSVSEDFAIIHNPDYIFPPYEIIPLAKKIASKRDHLSAIVSDMDGTTTTTEELCLYSLEYMVRMMSGRFTTMDWHGLDKTIDYPNIIGNSTTKHVEFLINRYSNYFDSNFISKAYIKAIVWQLNFGKDKVRMEEILNNIKLFQLDKLLENENFNSIKNIASLDDFDTNPSLIYLLQNFKPIFDKTKFSLLVKLGIDIYYYKYHEILARIKNGESKSVALNLFGNADKNLIEPMPGIPIFLALIKGWITDNFETYVDLLITQYQEKCGSKYFYQNKETLISNFKLLASTFNSSPTKIGIVTSSIFYEAEIVLTEVFNVIKKQIATYPLPDETKQFLIDKFSNYNSVYDSIVTASDSNEIRLKPHRDLYSIALHNLHISKNDFINVIGLEDSESGTFAIRAAGIGCCVAVPFAQTSFHNFEAASLVSKGGLPELILTHNLFLL